MCRAVFVFCFVHFQAKDSCFFLIINSCGRRLETQRLLQVWVFPKEASLHLFPHPAPDWPSCSRWVWTQFLILLHWFVCVKGLFFLHFFLLNLMFFLRWFKLEMVENFPKNHFVFLTLNVNCRKSENAFFLIELYL